MSFLLILLFLTILNVKNVNCIQFVMVDVHGFVTKIFLKGNITTYVPLWPIMHV